MRLYFLMLFLGGCFGPKYAPYYPVIQNQGIENKRLSIEEQRNLRIGLIYSNNAKESKRYIDEIKKSYTQLYTTEFVDSSMLGYDLNFNHYRTNLESSFRDTFQSISEKQSITQDPDVDLFAVVEIRVHKVQVAKEHNGLATSFLAFKSYVEIYFWDTKRRYLGKLVSSHKKEFDFRVTSYSIEEASKKHSRDLRLQFEKGLVLNNFTD